LILLLPSQQPRRYPNETDTTPPEDHTEFHQLSVESPTFPEPRNAFHMRIGVAPIGNTTFPRTDIFRSFIRPSMRRRRALSLTISTRLPTGQTRMPQAPLPAGREGQIDVTGSEAPGTCIVRWSVTTRDRTFFARCYGWSATSDYRFKIGDFPPTGAGCPKISGGRGRPHQPFYFSVS